MEVLSFEKLDSINGGGKKLWYLLGAGLSFFLGLFSGLVNPVKCNQEGGKNMYLEKRELDQVVGGASASFFNSVARILRTAYDIGYSIGSSLRRLFSRNLCKI